MREKYLTSKRLYDFADDMYEILDALERKNDLLLQTVKALKSAPVARRSKRVDALINTILAELKRHKNELEGFGYRIFGFESEVRFLEDHEKHEGKSNKNDDRGRYAELAFPWDSIFGNVSSRYVAFEEEAAARERIRENQQAMDKRIGVRDREVESDIDDMRDDARGIDDDPRYGPDHDPAPSIYDPGGYSEDDYW